MRFHPNPVVREMTVDFRWSSTTSLTATVHDTQGRLVTRLSELRTGRKVDMSLLSAGTYVIRFYNRKGEMIYRTFLLKR
ncbi:MAG: T9SS C-terminal target domain-containing protein [Acidobacteria bacterium]|nr:T9SS C-terminal target domain-containing protein [Acidobacteriota bacterium]